MCREEFQYRPPKFGACQSNYSVPAGGAAHLHCPVNMEDNIPLSFPLVSFTFISSFKRYMLLNLLMSEKNLNRSLNLSSFFGYVAYFQQIDNKPGNIIVKLPTHSGYQICARRNGFLFFKLGKQMLLLCCYTPQFYSVYKVILSLCEGKFIL